MRKAMQGTVQEASELPGAVEVPRSAEGVRGGGPRGRRLCGREKDGEAVARSVLVNAVMHFRVGA